jgi:hypothetical protein
MAIMVSLLSLFGYGKAWGETGDSDTGTAFTKEDIVGFVDIIKRRVVEDFRWGMSVEEKFDDNIFNTWDGGKEADFITTVSPSVNYKYAPSFFGGKSKISPQVAVNLSGDIQYYAYHTELNRTRGTFNQLFQPSFSAVVEPSDKVRLHYDISRRQENVADIDPLGAADSQRKIDTYSSSYGARYSFGPKRGRYEVVYEHSEGGYADEYKPFTRAVDRISVTAVTADQAGVPKFFVDYHTETTTYPESGRKGGTIHELGFGLRGNFSPKISGTTRIGYGLRHDEDDNIGDSVGTFVTDTSLTYRITRRFSCDLGVTRSVRNVDYVIDEEDDDFFNIPDELEVSDRYRLGCSYTPPFFSENLMLGADVSQSDFEFASGKKQKVREAGFFYRYTWDHRSKGYWKHGWILMGTYRFRKISPNEDWQSYTDNWVSLKLTTEF